MTAGGGRRRFPVPEGFPGRVTFVKSASRLQEAPHMALPEICVAGRSNVGKSSLLNTLAKRKGLAKVSQTPGRTRLLNFFDVQGVFALCDLPGYGFAKVDRAEQERWGEMVRGYLEDRPQLVLALLLVDIRRDPADEEKDLIAWFRAHDLDCLLVATKADKVPASRRGPRVSAIARSLGVQPAAVVAFSSLTKEGREELLSRLLAAATPPPPAEAPGPAGEAKP